MPHDVCPLCKEPGRPLTDLNKYTRVEYYRCDRCWRVWTQSKAHPNEPPRQVTTDTTDRAQAN